MAKREAEPFLENATGGNAAHGSADAQPHDHKHANLHVVAEPPVAKPAKKRSFVRPLVLVALLAGAAWWGGNTAYAWWTDGRFLVETDDAYVAADITTLAAKATGYVTDVRIKDNQAVKAGDVILKLDDGDYRIALRQAQAAIDGNRATVDRIVKQIATAKAQVTQAEAQVAAAAAKLTAAEADFARKTQLVSSAVSSQSQLDDARADRDAARASLSAADAAVDVARANVAVLEAQQVEAEKTGETLAANLAKAERDLTFTEIRAPVDGIVGNTTFKLGSYVTPGQTLGSLVALATAHIDANYKETQVADLRPGEEVRISVDAFDGHKEIVGTVESLSPATGSVFSLLPANNATGNFTKVVQRLPVRIALPAEVAASGYLRPGMSVVVAADTRTAPQT